MQQLKTYKLYFVIVLTLFIHQTLLSQNWEEQAIGILPIDYGVFDISVVDENIVWGIAFDQTISSFIPTDHRLKVIKTVDGGNTWECFDVFEATGRISFDIEAFDADVALISTQDYNNGIGRSVFKTEDGGNNWVEKLNHRAAGVWIKFFNDQDGVVINRQNMATTQDGGESWELIPSDNIPPFKSNESTLLSSGNNSCQIIDDIIWFGTDAGRVFRSKNKGHSWEVFNTSLGTDAIVTSVTFRDSLRGLALDVSTPSTIFSETFDGGETWSNLDVISDIDIANMAFVPGTESVIVGTSDIYSPYGNRVSVYSTDFGKSWTTINSFVAFAGIQFLNQEVGWASRGRIFTSFQPAMFKWDSNIFVTSTEDELFESTKIYPNPFLDHISLESSSNEFNAYRLLDANGMLIQNGKIDSKAPNVKFQNLDLGIYVLQIITNQGKVVTKKIFKVN